MTRGGKRKGAGRKPGIASILAEKTRAYIAERVENDSDELVSAQLEKAKRGDTYAFNTLMDRAFGKPTQGVEMSGKDGEPLLQIDDNQYKQLIRAAIARISNDKGSQ